MTAIEDRLAATRTTLDLSIDASDGAGISWLHRNAEVLNKELHDGRFDMTVRVDETKRDIVISKFDAVPHVALTVVPLRTQGPIATGSDLCTVLAACLIARFRGMGPGSRFAWPGRRWAAPRLRLVPQRVHLFQRCVLERTALRRERTLDIGEAALELGVGAAQRGFRIGADVAGQVDQREQEVAGFGSEFVSVAVVQSRFDLVRLFADLAEHRAGIVPVEADGGGLALQLHRPRQCRLARLDAR